MKKVPARYVKRKPGETAREAVLRVLKIRGELSARELAKSMNITYTALQRHLSQLQHEGLISSKQIHHGVAGRPVNLYRLTPEATDKFPGGYEQMAGNLLDTLFEEGGHVRVMDFLRDNNSRLLSQLKPRFDGKNLAERVKELAAYFTENGYMTSFAKLKDGDFFLYHQNCAIYKLAVRYRQLCILEPRLMEELLGVKVFRQQYILKDHPVCGYLVDSKRTAV
ncbi:MAG: ArsR family transcriptional regulator [Cyanobacteria bacterium]|nr:ArsR family transcriptional regulator [Cyanobacteriota bacterium]